jgi:hypothetical protein
LLRNTVRKEKGGGHNGVGSGLLFLCLHPVCLFGYSGVRGGGKCPEEELTTCSGGPTIIIVTSAVYGERKDFIKYSIL